MSLMPDEDTVRDALRQVDDPEVGMNIVDLGLVYNIAVGDSAVFVDVTMTTAACPMADMIMDDMRNAIRPLVPQGTAVEVELVWDPPWSPEKMSGFAREHFGWSPGAA